MFTPTDFTVENLTPKLDGICEVVMITDVVFSRVYLVNSIANSDKSKSNYYTFKPVKLVVQ